MEQNIRYFKAILWVRATERKIQWNMAKIQKLGCFVSKKVISQSPREHIPVMYFSLVNWKVIRWCCRPRSTSLTRCRVWGFTTEAARKHTSFLFSLHCFMIKTLQFCISSVFSLWHSRQANKPINSLRGKEHSEILSDTCATEVTL